MISHYTLVSLIVAKYSSTIQYIQYLEMGPDLEVYLEASAANTCQMTKGARYIGLISLFFAYSVLWEASSSTTAGRRGEDGA